MQNDQIFPFEQINLENGVFVSLECVSGMCPSALEQRIDTDSWLNQNPFLYYWRTLDFFSRLCPVKNTCLPGSYKPWFLMWPINRMKVDEDYRG